MRTPKSLTNPDSACAIGAGSSGYTASPMPVLSGNPAFGITDSGSVACSDRYLTGSRPWAGAGGAIESDDIDLERFECRHRAGDVGAEQHAPADVERNLSLDGQAAAYLCEQS